MRKNFLAPIVLLVYNRLDLTKKVINALKNNPLSGESELYIFSDAPKNKKDVLGVKDVRKFIKTIKGFRKVHIVERENNYGVSKNLLSSVTEILKIHGKIIVLEDDDVPLKYFLKYMNDSLDIYKAEKNVGAVSAFVFPLGKGLPETYFLRFFSSWGWGTWSDRWKLFEKNGKILYNSIKKKNLTRPFNLNETYPFTRILRNQIRGNNDSWSVRWYASLFLNNRLTLFPKESLIENIGFGEKGTHCQNNWYDETNVYDKEITVKKIPFEQDEKAYIANQKYFKRILWKRFLFKIKRIIKHPLDEIKNL
jgi:hypothetical protein